MLKFLLATVISLSASVREPRQVPTAPFDYELSYQIENTYKGFEGSFKHDYEREDGDKFNDITAQSLFSYILNQSNEEIVFINVNDESDILKLSLNNIGIFMF